MNTNHDETDSRVGEPPGAPSRLQRLAYGWPRQLLSCFAILGFVAALYSVGTYGKTQPLQVGQAPAAGVAAEAGAPEDARGLALRAKAPLNRKASPANLLGARTAPRS